MNRHRQRGYTAVEVLSAMTLFAIGAAGVIGMQRVTIQGGADAHRFDVAVNIANEWTSRLQRDSTRWTEPSAASPATINLSTNTKWVKDVASCSTAFCGPTLPASGSEAGMSPAFDSFGRDLPTGTTDAMYCVQYRLQWIAPPGSAPNLNLTALMRAEVRVFWSRLEKPIIGDCTNPPEDPDGTNAHKTYHFVYATTAIRENPDR